MSIIAKRYAQALFELAQEQGQLDSVQEEIELIAASLRQHVALAEVLNHPQISADRKKTTMLSIFGSHLSDISRHFMQLLIDKGRQDLLSSIVEEFVALANELRGVTVGTAFTAVQLTDSEQQSLKTMFSGKMGKQVQLDNIVDPAIKGGVLVRVADRIYDGSVSGKLARFTKRLKTVQV